MCEVYLSTNISISNQTNSVQVSPKMPPSVRIKAIKFSGQLVISYTIFFLKGYKKQYPILKRLLIVNSLCIY